MEALGISMSCSQSAIEMSHASQSRRRFAQRSLSGMQATQRRFSVRAFQRARSTSSPVVPACSPNSPINAQNGLLGSSAFPIERLPSERSPLSRLEMELMREPMMRRMVRAEKEPSEKDTEDEPDKTNDSGYQLWMNRSHNVQTNMQIFGSMMFWIVLFFVSSIMDGDNRGWREPRNRRSNRGRPK